jgi:hypothetical protein
MLVVAAKSWGASAHRRQEIAVSFAQKQYLKLARFSHAFLRVCSRITTTTTTTTTISLRFQVATYRRVGTLSSNVSIS